MNLGRLKNNSSVSDVLSHGTQGPSGFSPGILRVIRLGLPWLLGYFTDFSYAVALGVYWLVWMKKSASIIGISSCNITY